MEETRQHEEQTALWWFPGIVCCCMWKLQKGPKTRLGDATFGKGRSLESGVLYREARYGSRLLFGGYAGQGRPRIQPEENHVQSPLLPQQCRKRQDPRTART